MNALPALNHLKRDPILNDLIERYQPPQWSGTDDLFEAIIETVAGQQLSVKAAAAIIGRVRDLFPQRKPTPHAVLACTEEDLRAAGLSGAKVRSVREIAEAIESKRVDLEALRTLPDDEVTTELCRLRGIGPWTAEMLLIFDLGRPDVFSAGDLGLRTAVSRLYGIDRDDLPTIIALSGQWSPYRSYACHYLWKSLDNKPR